MRRGTPTQRAAVRALALLCAVLAMWLASGERAARAAAMHPPEAAALGGRVGGCPRAEAAKPPSTRCSTCAPRRGAPPLLLDRITSHTRQTPGQPDVVATYTYNALGALKTHAGVAVDDERPRLDGAGTAAAAIPASAGGSPVEMDVAGKVTSLFGTTLRYSSRDQLVEAQPPVPAPLETYGHDTELRRISKSAAGQDELYLYEGPNRVGVIERGAGAGYTTKDTYLFAGIDDALRLKRGSQVVYFETDLAGNVRRLRAPGGGDLGGYRYSAFGKTVEDTAAVDQPHRWKGRWYSQVAGGIYDVRARQWSPQVGAFLTLDEFAFHDPKTTLWGWPGQNPVRYRDPSGRYFEKEAAENPVAFGIALSLLPVLWPAAGLAMPLGTGLASDDARMQAAAHPNQSFAEQASMLASVVGMSSVASQGAVACSNRAAIARARAACPGGDCRLLANTLAEQHGGRIRTLEPLPGQGTLPGHPDWLFHEAVEAHTGEVLDPLNATTYPSVDAWRRAVVGNAEVNVGARDWPPRNRPPYENF